ncbi:hypothetical protein B0H19DRAFT_1241573 [Mycena capillaripes]|nr:hypothetical protein B0H19DRAFT_1241573 [Mycena capillaripes]
MRRPLPPRIGDSQEIQRDFAWLLGEVKDRFWDRFSRRFWADYFSILMLILGRESPILKNRPNRQSDSGVAQIKESECHRISSRSPAGPPAGHRSFGNPLGLHSDLFSKLGSGRREGRSARAEAKPTTDPSATRTIGHPYGPEDTRSLTVRLRGAGHGGKNRQLAAESESRELNIVALSATIMHLNVYGGGIGQADNKTGSLSNADGREPSVLSESIRESNLNGSFPRERQDRFPGSSSLRKMWRPGEVHELILNLLTELIYSRQESLTEP